MIAEWVNDSHETDPADPEMQMSEAFYELARSAEAFQMRGEISNYLRYTLTRMTQNLHRCTVSKLANVEYKLGKHLTRGKIRVLLVSTYGSQNKVLNLK